MKFTKTIAFIKPCIILFCFVSNVFSSDLGQELKLQQDELGPSYKETVEFIHSYPNYINDKVKVENLKIESCVINFDWQFQNGNSGKSAIPIKDFPMIESNRYQIWFYNKNNRFKSSPFPVLRFHDEDIKNRFYKAFQHLSKLCVKESPF